MILYNQLHFFNKRGNDLNLEKEIYVKVTVNRNETYEKFNDNQFVDAEIEAITNEYGKLEFFRILAPGAGYDETTTISIEDIDTKVSYEILSTYIDIDSETGMILGVTMPQEMTGFSFPSIVWKGSIFLEKVSTGLIASDQIFILEEMYKLSEDGEVPVYSSPRTYTDNAEYTSSILAARFKHDEYEEEEDAINLFTVDYDDDVKPVINVQDDVTINLEDGSRDVISSFGVRKIRYKKSTAIAFDLMLTTEYEGVFERTLEIYEKIGDYEYPYAEILIHGETEGEDERLKLALENFGISISEAEEKIFRDSSVNEDLHDYRILNQKRKEMLLEYHNIFPFLGSYKGLVNMINYFGYGDTRLKEYWLNTEKSIRIAKKKSGDGHPFELTRLHRYAIDNSHVGLMSFNNFELDKLGSEEVPIYKLPKISDDNVDLRDNKITDIPKIENGVVKGKVVNELEEHIDLRSFDQDLLQKKIIDDDLAARVIRRESYKIEDVKPEDMQYSQVEVPMQLAQKGKDYLSEEMTPTDYWRKTNMFGLFYDIVRETGEYDIDGMPITEDAFMFSEDEILIKLFGLREYLKDKFMPVNARIVDIVGEGVYYYRTDINTWKDDCTIYTVNKDDEIDFDIIPTKSNYIEDLHNYGELEKQLELDDVVGLYKDHHPHNMRLVEKADYSALDKAVVFASLLDTSKLEKHSWDKARMYLVEARDLSRDFSIEYQYVVDNSLEALELKLKEIKTSEGKPIDVPTFYKDGVHDLIEKPWNDFKNNQGPVGCEVTLKLKDFIVTWDDMECAWDELNDTNWLGLDTKNYADVEWKIAFKPAKGDGRSFEIEDRGPISNYSKTQSFADYEELAYVLNNSKQDDWNVNNNLIFAEKMNIKKRYYISAAEETYEPYGQDQSPWSEEQFEEDVKLAEEYFDGLKIGFFRIKEIPEGVEYMTTSDHREFKVVLPYAGDYAIQCSVYDYTNTPISKTVTYKVEMYKADFFIFGRSFENLADTWDDANFSWDDANLQWRTSGKDNDLTWDDLDGITWDDLKYSNYTKQFNPFDTEMKDCIISISEADRLIGNVMVVVQDKEHQVVVLSGCKNIPPIEAGDLVIARNGEAKTFLKVFDATYNEDVDTTTLVLSKESIVTNNTELLRECCGDIVLKGDRVTDNLNGINQGKYLLFRSREYDELRRKKIEVTKPIYDGDKIVGISLAAPVTVIPREFGYLYERKEFAVTSDNLDPVNKTIKIESKLEVDEIVPGFTIIHIENGADDSQRLLVKKYLGDKTYEVVELDGDMGVASGIAWYEFHKMTVKVSQKESQKVSNEVMLDFNDYPLNEAFKEDAEHWDEEEQQVNWYFDYIVKDGSFSVEVESYSLKDDGNTYIHLKDTYNELLQASPRFLVSWSSFDEEYAERRYGTEIFSWDNFDEVTWDELDHLTWNMFDYFQAPHCGFEIHAIAPGGTIQFNEMPRFQFKKLTSANDWEGACQELNETENEAMNKFIFRVSQDENGFFIEATAKFESASNLGYLKFENGVMGFWDEGDGISHTYPTGDFEDWIDPYKYGLNNKYAMWHPVARAYYEYGVKEAHREADGSIDENKVIRGWYPATRITEVAPKHIENTPAHSTKNYEDCTYDWNEATILENIDKFKENSALYFERGENADALYGQFPSLLKSVDWRYDENERNLYDNALSSPFTWNDLIGSNKEIEVKKMTTLFFTPSNCKPSGRVSYLWTLLRYDGKENECVIKNKDSLVWTFSKPGWYDVVLDIVDMNGNKTNVTKRGVVKVI